MLQIPTSMKSDPSYAKFTAISRQVSPASLLSVSVGHCQIALVNESGMIITQMGSHNRSEVVAVHGTPCSTPPLNGNSNYLPHTCP
jgi:hypothetical protein